MLRKTTNEIAEKEMLDKVGNAQDIWQLINKQMIERFGEWFNKDLKINNDNQI